MLILKLLGIKLELMVYPYLTNHLHQMALTFLEARVVMYRYKPLITIALMNSMNALEFLLSVDTVTEAQSEVVLVESSSYLEASSLKNQKLMPVEVLVLFMLLTILER